MNKKVFLILALSFINIISYAQEYTVSGYIKDAKKQEPIIGAAVFEAYTVTNGTPTDADGYFSLDFDKKKVVIKVAYVGFKDTIINLSLTEDTTISIFLKSETNIDAVEIDRDKENWKPKDNSIAGKGKNIYAEPINIGSDIKQGYIIIPKISNEIFITNLDNLFLQNAQGTNQALTIIDGARLYSTKQAFNFLPIIDKNSIKSIKYSYNNYPATYGGYISPVIDINMKEGSLDSFVGSGTISLYNAKLNIEGPVIKDVSSLFVSGGISYFNNIYTNLYKKQSGNQQWTKPSYYDLFLKYTHQLTENDKVYTSFYTTTNKNKYEYDEEVLNSISYVFNNNISEKITNTLMSAHWEHVFSPNFISKIYLTYSRYNLSQSFSGDSIGLALGNPSQRNKYLSEQKTGNDDLSFNINFKYNIFTEHKIEFGGSATNHNFRPIKGTLVINDLEHNFNKDTTFEASTYNAQEYIVFAQDKYLISDVFHVQGGIHFSTFKTKNKTFFSVQPRIFVEYELFDWVSINTSYSNYKQYLHAISNRQIGLTTDIFIASSNDILPQFTHHFSAGARLKLPFAINLTTDFFYNNSVNVTEYKYKYGYFNNNDKFDYAGINLKDRIEQGKENLFGMRVLINKDFEKFSVKVAHYMSFSNRTFTNLNIAKSFPYRYNNMHDFSLRMSYKITDDFNIGINWIYKSGNNVTPNRQSYIAYDYDAGKFSSIEVEKDTYSINNELIVDTGTVNDYKLPAYHRADLYLNYTIDNHSIGLSIYNVYNKKNTDFIDFERGTMTNANNYQLVNYTTLPFFPVLSYTYVFE